MPDVLTVSEVAAMFNVTPAAVRRWEKIGKLSARKTAKGVRFFDLEIVQLFALRRMLGTRQG